MDISLTLTDDERHACRRTAVLLRAVAKGLEEIGTRREAEEIGSYAVTIDAIVASGECCSVSSDGKVDVEQAGFILEGIRDALDNAALDEGPIYPGDTNASTTSLAYKAEDGKAVSERLYRNGPVCLSTEGYSIPQLRERDPPRAAQSGYPLAED